MKPKVTIIAPPLEIVIKGHSGSGKTGVAREIKKMLIKLGFTDIEMIEGGQKLDERTTKTYV